jgi:hypothetical protein
MDSSKSDRSSVGQRVAGSASLLIWVCITVQKDANGFSLGTRRRIMKVVFPTNAHVKASKTIVNARTRGVQFR